MECGKLSARELKLSKEITSIIVRDKLSEDESIRAVGAAIILIFKAAGLKEISFSGDGVSVDIKQELPKSESKDELLALLDSLRELIISAGDNEKQKKEE